MRVDRVLILRYYNYLYLYITIICRSPPYDISVYLPVADTANVTLFWVWNAYLIPSFTSSII